MVHNFPQNDHSLSFHVVNCWHLLERSIRRKHDSDQWHFFEGMSQPPAKKKKAKSETPAGAVSHEERRKCIFLPSWQKDKLWLVFGSHSDDSDSGVEDADIDSDTDE